MKRSVKILWRLFFCGILFVVIIFACANFGAFGKMPSVVELQNPEADLASEVYTSDGVLMGKYYAENRSEVKYSDISPNIIHALIATEDQNFYDHSGIDARAVARAVLKLGTDGGGSPITQQVAKMMLGQGRGNLWKRGVDKLKEWIIAVKLERNFTKEEIITLYLNRAPWGNIYGIRNASRSYFQKEPSELSIEEAAVLIRMLKGFNYDPIRYPKTALDGRNTVIERMVDCKQHYITEAEAAALKAKPLITNYKKPDENVGIAPYFRVVLAGTLKEWCKNHKNPKTGESYDLLRDGLKIYTTINSTMQKYAEESVQDHMPVIQKKLNWNLKVRGDRMWKGHESTIEQGIKQSERWKNMAQDELKPEEIRKSFDVPVKMKIFAWNAKKEIDTVMTPYDSVKYHKQLLQTSFVCMDPKTGEVKCWVGGMDFKWFKFDHVTAQRQVGSTIKPLLYTLAVKDAGYTPATMIEGGSAKYGTGVYSGSAGSLANCLAFSKNIAAIRIINLVGVEKTVEFAQNCGITAKLPHFASLALGAAEIPILQMLQAYSMFPNKGLNTSPVLINRIEDKNGNLLQSFQAETKQVIAESDAYTMVSLMQGVVKFGTGRSLNSYGIPVEKAGKTGTTNDNADGWFMGYTPELIAGTWVGCEDPFIQIYSGTSGGNEMALPNWGNFMKKVYADKKLGYGKIKEFEKPAATDNNPIFADGYDLESLVNRGDENNISDIGNGDSSDFSSEPPSDFKDNTIDPGIKTDKPDTSKSPAKKPSDKKEPASPAVKPKE